MGIFLWVIFGGLVGWVSSIIMKTNAQQGLIINVIVGVIGAVVGGLIMNLLGFGGVGGFTLYSFLVALLGAIVLTWVVKAIRR